MYLNKYFVCIHIINVCFILQVLSLVVFICITSHAWYSVVGGGWVQFVSISCLITVLILWIFFMLRIIYKLPGPWSLIVSIFILRSYYLCYGSVITMVSLRQLLFQLTDLSIFLAQNKGLHCVWILQPYLFPNKRPQGATIGVSVFLYTFLYHAALMISVALYFYLQNSLIITF